MHHLALDRAPTRDAQDTTKSKDNHGNMLAYKRIPFLQTFDLLSKVVASDVKTLNSQLIMDNRIIDGHFHKLIKHRNRTNMRSLGFLRISASLPKLNKWLYAAHN